MEILFRLGYITAIPQGLPSSLSYNCSVREVEAGKLPSLPFAILFQLFGQLYKYFH